MDRILFPEEVAEVGNRVLGIPHKEVLCLLTIILLTINIRENGRDLSICEVDMSAHITRNVISCRIPPSSFAITSALSSTVCAIELLELPKAIPITVRSPGAGAAFLSLILVNVERKPVQQEEITQKENDVEVVALGNRCGWVVK